MGVPNVMGFEQCRQLFVNTVSNSELSNALARVIRYDVTIRVKLDENEQSRSKWL